MCRRRPFADARGPPDAPALPRRPRLPRLPSRDGEDLNRDSERGVWGLNAFADAPPPCWPDEDLPNSSDGDTTLPAAADAAAASDTSCTSSLRDMRRFNRGRAPSVATLAGVCGDGAPSTRRFADMGRFFGSGRSSGSDVTPLLRASECGVGPDSGWSSTRRRADDGREVGVPEAPLRGVINEWRDSAGDSPGDNNGDGGRRELRGDASRSRPSALSPRPLPWWRRGITDSPRATAGEDGPLPRVPAASLILFRLGRSCSTGGASVAAGAEVRRARRNGTSCLRRELAVGWRYDGKLLLLPPPAPLPLPLFNSGSTAFFDGARYSAARPGMNRTFSDSRFAARRCARSRADSMPAVTGVSGALWLLACRV